MDLANWALGTSEKFTTGVKYHFHQFHSPLYIMGGSPGDVSEEPVTSEKQKKGWRMSCDVGQATEVLENGL